MIATHHAHQRDAVNVVTLGDHLRAHEDVEVPLAKIVEDVFELAFAGHRIAVEPGDFRFGKLAVQLIFHALGLRTDPPGILFLAVRHVQFTLTEEGTSDEQQQSHTRRQ